LRGVVGCERLYLNRRSIINRRVDRWSSSRQVISLYRGNIGSRRYYYMGEGGGGYRQRRGSGGS